MERPQNGINGNIPNQNFGYLPTYVASGMSRNNSPHVYNYENMQQVMPNYTTSGYHIQQPVPNSFRQMSPSMPQQMQNLPLVYTQNYNMLPSHYNTFASYPYNSPVHISYSPEVQQTPPKNPIQPQTGRKLIPLVVIDPNSKTDVDLSKYQSTSEKSSSSKVLQISDPSTDENKEKDVADIEKENSPQLDSKDDSNKFVDLTIKKNFDTHFDIVVPKEVSDKGENGSTEKIAKKDDCIPMEIKIKSVIDAESNSKTDLSKVKSDSNMEIRMKASNIDMGMLETSTNRNVDIQNLSTKDNFESKIQELDFHATIHKDVSSLKSNTEEESIACSSEEDIHHVKPNLTSLACDYHLHVNTKESDETTLKRKLIYDREYLIKFKDMDKSLHMPLNMPSTSEFPEDIISSKPRTISCQLPESTPNVTYADKSGYKKQPPRQYSTPVNKKYNRPTERKQINLDMCDNQVFIRSKSGYLPPQFRDKQILIDPHTKLKRDIKSNLNKITPQNFQDCLAEIEKLNIEDKEEMSCLINEIFIKAVKEEAYSVTYAQFCNKLAGIYCENQSFKGQLLKKCQDMFETPLQEQLDTVKSDWEFKISNEIDLKMKALYESDLEEQVKKAKDKYFGNIRFIGELFLHNLLAAKVISNCIVELLKGSADPDAMLALCKLLETCGKQIDTKHKEKMNDYISQIHELSTSTTLEKRIRFKLRDIVDMRDRDWTLRHVQQEKKINPKTLQEQKEEAAAEAAASAIKLAAMNKKRNIPNSPSNNSKRNENSVAIKQLTIKKPNSHQVDEKTVLGPVGANWISGSGSKPKSRDSMERNEGWTPVPHQKPRNAAVRYTSNSRSREQSPQVMFANKYRTLESSAEASGADSRSSTPPLVPPLSTRNYRIRINESELAMSDEERSHIIFNELLSTGHFNVNSWLQLLQVKPVIGKWMDDMLEKDASCRRSIGDSLNALIMDGKLTTEQIVEGTQAFVSSIDDLMCDIPKLWEFLAQFLERFIFDKNSNISFFEKIFKSILPSFDVATCFSMAFHEASSRLGHNIVGHVFHRSLDWNRIVPKDVETFIKDNDLEFTQDGGASLSPYGGEPLNYIAEELDDMFSNNSSNEKIFDFLEKHVDKPTWKKTEYMRIITSSILKALKIMPDYSSVREYLKNKNEIIRRISNRKKENEIEILKAILNIASDLRKDILLLTYDILTAEMSSDAVELYLNDTSLQSDHNFALTHSIISQITIENLKR